MNFGKYTRANPYGKPPTQQWTGEKAPPLKTFPGLQGFDAPPAARPRSGHTVSSDLAQLSVGTAASWQRGYARRRRRPSSGRPSSAATTAINFILPYRSGGKQLTPDERRYKAMIQLDRISARRQQGRMGPLISVDSSAAVAPRWLGPQQQQQQQDSAGRRSQPKGWVRLREQGSGWSLVAPIHRLPGDGDNEHAAAPDASPPRRRQNAALQIVRRVEDIDEKCYAGQRVALMGTVVKTKLYWPHDPSRTWWEGCGLCLGDGTIVNFEDGYDEVPEAWEAFLRKPVRVEAQIWASADPGMQQCVRGPHMTNPSMPWLDLSIHSPVLAGGGARRLPTTHSREIVRRSVLMPQCRGHQRR